MLDDVTIVAENPLIRDLANAGHFFRADYWTGAGADATIADPGLYRPLTVLTYALDYRLWGLNATAFHVVNVVLHMLASVVFLIGATEIVGSPLAATAAAAVFAVHPLHTEAVAGIVGRAEVLGTFLFLLAFWAGRLPRRRAVLCGVLYLLALFSKETAVTLPAVFLLDDWLHRDALPAGRAKALRQLAPRYAALGVALAVYLAFRFSAVTHPAYIWAGFSGVSAGARVLTASRVLAEYVCLFVWPRTLLPDYWLTDVPIAHSIAEPLVAFSLALWIALAVLVVRRLRDDRVFVFGVGWFFITILPVSNLLFRIGVGKAERILYLPSAGLCLLVGWAVLRLERPAARRWAVIALAPILLALAARTVRRNADWKDNLSLATAALRTSPGSPVMNDLAAGELARRGAVNEALPLLREAVRQAPEKSQLHVHLGIAYARLGQPDQAIAEYTTALRLSPGDADAHNDLGVAYLDQHRVDDAVQEFAAAIRANPAKADAHVNLGSVYLDLHRLDEAIAEFRTAVQLNPSSPEAHNNLGVAYLRSAQLDSAAAQFEQALGLRPGYESARKNLSAVQARSR